MSTTFEAFGLAAPLLRALTDLGYTEPTPVQVEAIPGALAGGDWLVGSQTGSGKTAAFLLPTLQGLVVEGPMAIHRTAAPRVLVLCPTRELAQQVSAEAIRLVRHVKKLRIATVVGGMPFGAQIAALKGADLVVATPGRLLDLVERRQIRIDSVRSLVVDEADRMLDLGFSEALAAIHEGCATRDQTLMFSATFAPRIVQLASRLMREPKRIELSNAQDVHADIEQRLHWADNGHHKRKLLSHYLNDTGGTVGQVLVFASTQADTEILARELNDDGHQAAPLHGAMPQALRNRRLKSLREHGIKILVATDVAARGLDVPSISHVINFGLPMNAEDYVHRIGRTGRAGRQGTAITLADPRDRIKLRAIERLTGHPIIASTVPGLEPTAPQKRPERKFDTRRPPSRSTSSEPRRDSRRPSGSFAPRTRTA